MSNFLIGFLFGVIIGAIAWEVVKWAYGRYLKKGNMRGEQTMRFSWKWIILSIGIFFILLIVAYGGTGYRAVRDWIVADQATIQRELESEVTRLDKERDQYLKQISQLQQERVRLNGEYKKLKDKYAQLEDQMAHIDVPTNLGDLALAYQRKGYRARAMLPTR